MKTCMSTFSPRINKETCLLFKTNWHLKFLQNHLSAPSHNLFTQLNNWSINQQLSQLKFKISYLENILAQLSDAKMINMSRAMCVCREQYIHACRIFEEDAYILHLVSLSIGVKLHSSDAYERSSMYFAWN